MDQRHEQKEWFKQWGETLHALNHDLKAPLISIQGFAHLLLEEGPSAKAEDIKYSLKRILANVDSMQAMLANLTDYFRLEILLSEEIPMEKIDAIQIENWTEHFIFEKEKSFPLLPKFFHFELACGNHRFRGNCLWLEKLCRVLFENALKYADPKNPKIHFQGKVERDKAQFRVENNGIIIPEGEHEKVFDFLFRGIHQNQDSSGAGIGLTLARKITDLHQGKIWIEKNTPQNGTTVCFWLPLENQL